MLDSFCVAPHPAVVAKTDLASHAESFLQVRGDGAHWIQDPEAATLFVSMREAMRMAMRLPAKDRAYGLPRNTGAAAPRLQ